MGPDVLVIGGGAAGILAAWNAALHGARVLLLEKTDRLGTKILISGGGKCNVAHDGPLEDVIRAFRPNEARFLRPACHRLPNRTIIEMFATRGLEVYTRPDGRVFPVHKSGKDVVAILESYLAEVGVEIRRNCPVKGILAEAGRVRGVRADAETILCGHVVLCAGGSSYPKTGSTGDGWPWARALGHTIVPIRAALAPIYMDLDAADPRSGIALRDVNLKARLAGKEIARWRHDVLFTHKGVSGPAALGISRVVAERLGDGPITLEVDLTPDHPFEALSEQLRAWATLHPKRHVSGFLKDVVAERLEPELLAAAGLTNGPAHAVGKKALNRLVEAIKGWRLGMVRTVPLEKGEVVAGGVALDEVDAHTMRSLCCEGLYVCGEILDVAGPVGGYNLQAAFATGFVAGEAAAQSALSHRLDGA